MRRSWLAVMLIAMVMVLAVGGASRAEPHSGPAAVAANPAPPPLDQGLGHWHWTVSTQVPPAQQYFDQGLRLLYAFNPEEAEKSFREAARLDPQCAMCRWGVAISNGNNINVPRLPWRDSTEYAETQIARGLEAHANPKEQGLIEALARRTSMVPPSKPEDGAALDKAYSDAMRELAKQYPDDADVQTLFAESLMDLYPWHLWTPDLKPSPVTPELIATLEGVLKKTPDHPGANHFYIHTMEASAHPEKAVPSAERLRGKTPNAGHLVHMPSHIFERVGRYSEALESNRQAVKVDEAYFAGPNPGMLYTPYLAHNRQFMSYTAMIQGRYAESIAAAHAAAGTVPLEMLGMMPGMDFFCVTPYAVEIKFGRWDEALAEPMPPAQLIYTDAFWHFARAMAYAGKGDFAKSSAEHDSLTYLRDALAENAPEGNNSARTLLEIARHTLDGFVARSKQDWPAAIDEFQQAVKLEDGLNYNEPPDWLLFPRHDLGTALLAAGRAAEAEAVFRADLANHVETGWGLQGLASALRAQKKSAEADRVAARFQKAWNTADTKITAAAF